MAKAIPHRIQLNKQLSIWNKEFNACFGNFTVKDAAQCLTSYDVGDTLIVEFKSHEDFIEKDKKTYMRRVIKLAEQIGFEVQGDWQNKVKGGFVFEVDFFLELKRSTK